MIDQRKASPARKQQTPWQSKYGPWAIVTGASDGIGREMAICLAKRGLNLVLVARRRSILDEIAAEFSRDYNIETQVVDADLSQSAAVEMVLAETQFIDVGLLVASAGFGTAGQFLDMPLDREQNMLDVNCRAVLTMTHHYGQRFAKQKHGGIVLLSSLVAFQGVPLSTHYAATKAYIQSLAEGLHQELAPMGVDVLASAPGPINSGFAARANMHMGLALKPKDVAQATLDALGRKTTVRPGWLSKLLEGSLTILPRAGRVRVMGLVMKGMTQHHNLEKPVTQ